jgi:hypothetical protein
VPRQTIAAGALPFLPETATPAVRPLSPATVSLPRSADAPWIALARDRQPVDFAIHGAPIAPFSLAGPMQRSDAASLDRAPVDPPTNFGARTMANFAPFGWAHPPIPNGVQPPPPNATPQQLARAALATALASGVNPADEIYRTVAFLENAGKKPPTAQDVMRSVGSYGLADLPGLVKQVAKDVIERGDNPLDSYRFHRAALDDWLAQYGAPQLAAGSIEAARAQLARQLAAGKTSGDAALRAASFRLAPTAADWSTALGEGASLHTRDEIMAAKHAYENLAPGESFSESYPHYLAAERERLDQYEVAHPTAALALETLGRAATSLPIAGLLGVPGGILVGAIDGAASRTGDGWDRLEGAGEGAGWAAGRGLGQKAAKDVLRIRGHSWPLH